mmetsp:Transcript_5289/g.10965  ORF Transcript_5289/g.10965 Transcript_5289/m.10965 type:complete len:215 (+) Transcript_5289:609-1253(+)
MVPGCATTCPRLTSSRLTPRRRIPTLSPASPRARVFLCISTPVQVVLILGLLPPTTSISSPALTQPVSIRPVTTVPRPEIEKVSSTGRRKGLSRSRSGWGMKVSTLRMSSRTASLPIGSSRPSTAARAEPRMIGVSSPGKSWLSRSSRISISTISRSSSSSTWSTLLRKTTRAGTPTCLERSKCSRVWGMGPSEAETTRIPPSMVAAPVIMFLT